MGVSGATFANNHMKVVAVASTTEASELNLRALSNLKFVLSANKVGERTIISLLDEDKTVLFRDYANTNGDYTKIFDLSNLADGKYTFVVKNGVEEIEKTLEIKTSVERSATLN